jgi:hypothetical protein
MSAVLLTGRGGMGDAIYARPFVREAVQRYDEVYVSTSWPALFADLPVRPVKRLGGLATQAYHGDRVPDDVWHEPPPDIPQISLRYRWKQLAKKVSVLREMEKLSGIEPSPLALDLPPLPDSPLSGLYAVVRPPAIRCDYPAPSREPDPAYLAHAAARLQSRGFRVVTVGAFVPGLEEPNGGVPADVRFERGELPLMQAIALVAGAAVVVSAPCWLVPACVASRTPLIVIAGGCGGRNNPSALVDSRLDARHVQWLLPDAYCMCRRRDHACPKEIAEFPRRFDLSLNMAHRAARAA